MNGRYRQLMVVAALWFAASLAVPAAQTNVIITLPPGLQLVREKRDQPPQDLFVVTVDLKNPQVAVRVSPGGPDPDGPGEYQTTLMTVRAVAERDGYDVAVNGDFFSAKRTVDAHGNESGYLTGLWAKLTGAAMTDGKLWTGGAQPALWISRHGRASISRGGGGKAPPHCWQVISGHPLL
ncbi:MAG: hypothetical protein NTV49_10520, partial [Kiritimatiellaeota bacterium]|nr:hypothetical protein [Kiritimatiellota bacterium]